jgi:hypothetical protein
MSRASQTVDQYWDSYKPNRGDGLPAAPAVAGFEWTQHGPGHGPGAEWLGSPGTALELGAAECREAVQLARSGVRVTALDFSAAQVQRARAWPGTWAPCWSGPRWRDRSGVGIGVREVGREYGLQCVQHG